MSMSRPEVVPPASKHGIKFGDDLLHIFPAAPRIGQSPGLGPGADSSPWATATAACKCPADSAECFASCGSYTQENKTLLPCP